MRCVLIDSTGFILAATAATATTAATRAGFVAFGIHGLVRWLRCHGCRRDLRGSRNRGGRCGDGGRFALRAIRSRLRLRFACLRRRRSLALRIGARVLVLRTLIATLLLVVAATRPIAVTLAASITAPRIARFFAARLAVAA